MAKAPKTDTTQTDDVAAMKAELEQLRSEKGMLTAEVREARTAKRNAELQNMSAQERAVVSEQEACESRLSSLESEAQSYEDQIAQLADEPGHGRDIAVLNRKLATVSANLVREADRKAYLASQREKVTASNKERAAAPSENDRVLANGSRMSQYGPRTQAWLEAHPKTFSDSRYMKLAILAAQKATEIEGIKDESDEYFRFVEKELGEGQEADVEVDNQVDPDAGEEIAVEPPARTIQTYEPERPQSRAAGPGSMAAAPPTRQIPAGGGGGPRRAPSLTSEEREVALSLYPHLKSDADKLVAYAEGKKMMSSRQNKHFVSH